MTTAPRQRNAEQTRADILAAARKRFGAEGYDPTTIRAIASDVGVDPALVIRYFGSKQELFAAAADFTIELPDLTGVGAEDIAAMLLPRFFAVWEEDETFLALLRAATTSPVAAATLRAVFVNQIAPKLITATPDHPLERIGVMGAFVIGLATTRYILVNRPVANLSRDEVTRWAAPVIADLLVGPAPSADGVDQLLNPVERAFGD